MARDELLSKKELDYIVKELRQSQIESASTHALQPAKGFPIPRRVASIKTWFKGILIGLILALIAFFAWHFYANQAATLKSGSVVESIQKLATLATAQEQAKTIISQQDNKLFGKNISFNFPGTKRTIFLVVPAEVIAGVDLKDVTKKDMTLDTKTKTIHLTLPHATIVQDPSVDLKNIQAFSSEGVLRGSISLQDGFQLEDLAKTKIKQEAIQSGLLKTSEINATNALQDFFKNMGYSVTVTYK